MKRLGRVLLGASLDTRCAAIVLLLTAFAVYYPALDRMFADDQIHYLAELNGDTSLSAGLHHIDYAVTRRFWKGDDALFRPLLFVWLAIANHLFSYHHVWWNVASLLLHVLVALALFRLMVYIRPSPFALPAAVLFLVLKPPVELVLWNHLGGYLLAFLFFLLGTRALVGMARDPRDGWALTYAASFAVAAHLYEAMAVASLIGAALIVWTHWQTHRLIPWRHAVILVSPFLLFLALYGLHTTRVERLGYVDRPDSGDQLAPRDVGASVSLAAAVAGHWASELALPVTVRLATPPFARFVKSNHYDWSEGSLQLNAVLSVLAGVTFLSCLSLSQLKRQTTVLLFAAATLGVYVTVLGSGRARGEILGVTYYTYLFAVLTAVLLYSLVDFDRLLSSLWRSALAAIVVTAFIALHGSLASATARNVERENHYAARYFSQIVQFVDAHKREPDFSFAIQPHPETLDPSIYLVEGYPDEANARSERRLLSEIVFARYYNKRQPKYVLDFSAARIVR